MASVGSEGVGVGVGGPSHLVAGSSGTGGGGGNVGGSTSNLATLAPGAGAGAGGGCNGDSSSEKHVSTASAIAKLKEDEKKIQMVIVDINFQIALFRDLLIHVGSAKDCSELREKIRRVRRLCVEACTQTNTQLLPQIKSALSEGTILDNHQLVCLYMLSQLLERELDKCLRLVVAIPMDMSSFYETKPTPHGLGSVLSQIVLCKSMKPDFNAEEKLSIEKDSREIRQIITEMAECLPKEDPEKARKGLTNSDTGRRRWLIFRGSKRKQTQQQLLLHRRGTAGSGGGAGGGSGCGVNSSMCCLCTRAPSTPSTTAHF